MLFALLFAVSVFAQNTQRPLTNDDVIQMVKAKETESLIQSQLRNSKTNFDLSTTEIIRLTSQGVSENVIAMMRNPGLAASSASSSSASIGGIKTPDGEKVRLILADDISSSTANRGDRVNFTVAEDFKVGDAVIFAKGSSASGTITEAKKKGMLGQGGRLLMSIDQVKAIDGQNVRLRATSGREGDDKLGKTVAIAVLAGPFALLVKGKDVVVTKGTEYAAYIDESREIGAGK
jgi:hypothetical protein